MCVRVLLVCVYMYRYALAISCTFQFTQPINFRLQKEIQTFLGTTTVQELFLLVCFYFYTFDESVCACACVGRRVCKVFYANVVHHQQQKHSSPLFPPPLCLHSLNLNHWWTVKAAITPLLLQLRNWVKH